MAFLDINYASNWQEFTEALRHYVAPSQNFVPFSEVEFLKRFFDDRSIVTGRDRYTVDPSPFGIGAPFNACWVSSYRQIIDLAHLNNSRFMHTTGQSGNVFSRHYDDLIPRWRDVRYIPMYWTKENLMNSGGTSTLTLEPAG